MTDDREVDLDGVSRLAGYLVDEQGHDALVVNGTTGESPTTTDAEKSAIIRAVAEAVGDRARILAGVGTPSTAHTVALAREAAAAGAHGLLVVTPYYNKPPQAGLVAHFAAVADATELPIMVYDIPHRSGVPLETESLVRIAAHERIVAVKDAKGDLLASAWVMRRTDLAYYSGEDALTLPLLSIGAVGVVGTSTHLCGPQTRELIAAYVAGDAGLAARLHHQLLPLHTGIFRTQGPILVKAGLRGLGLPAGPVRPPLVEATAEQYATLVADCVAAGVKLPEEAA
ncbi:4-hydroxy-tetrahydrodipicolinate synthase 2 [Pilimelia terevasa]|uniref:4-hydroxy-tetrahydrodipicolinate synthase n=2 Tax=Pilimelia terevasa TaxID=53372 RepID=A0A8J3FH70_9ACTN|nr:4-hydroxy-tetrahydrodipicolinate synthase 2 [Pilimelia terevasa]